MTIQRQDNETFVAYKKRQRLESRVNRARKRGGRIVYCVASNGGKPYRKPLVGGAKS